MGTTNGQYTIRRNSSPFEKRTLHLLNQTQGSETETPAKWKSCTNGTRRTDCNLAKGTGGEWERDQHGRSTTRPLGVRQSNRGEGPVTDGLKLNRICKKQHSDWATPYQCYQQMSQMDLLSVEGWKSANCWHANTH